MSVEWTCDNCGHEGNLGRFCIKCGTENPVMRKLYPDPTGKLKEFRKSYWSSGMMIDSTSHEIYSLERQDDGSYVMKYDVLKTMMPTGTVSVYSVDQGQVEKLVNMIDEYKINTWAGLREQTPAAQVFDFSDSSSLFFSRFITGDSGPEKTFGINARAVRAAGQDKEKQLEEVSEFIESLVDPGKLVSTAEVPRKGIGAQPTMMNNGFMGMLFLTDTEVGGNKEAIKPELTLGPAPENMAGRQFWEDGETWICPECLCNENKGKFCVQCGARRPEKG